MIRRTLLEWRKLPYGEDDKSIPDWAADRIAAVARQNPLAGSGGSQILQHGRHHIRAQQVVGVLAAQGCELEILPKIDGLGGDETDQTSEIRQQLVHMLAATLKLRITDGQMAQLGTQRESVLETIIRLFTDRLFRAIHQGVPRRYIDMQDDLPTVRGQLSIIRQFTQHATRPQLLACRFDELSTDIPLNQIMKAAVSKLLNISRAHDNQRRLRELSLSLADISSIPVESLKWERVVLDRTNTQWHQLLAFAKLLLGDRFQTTSFGNTNGFSLLFEMNNLFEEYIGRMLQKGLRGTNLTLNIQSAGRYCLTSMNTPPKQLFLTRPDIIVRHGSRAVLIIDTKWKRLSSVVDDPKRGIKQSDVYQLMAYGRLYDCRNLMLLYPHHDGIRSNSGLVARHRVNGANDRLDIATVDLSDRSSVTSQLCGLVTGIIEYNKESIH